MGKSNQRRGIGSFASWAARKGQPDRLRPFYHHMEVIFHLANRNFILRYKGSLLGILWSLLFPLSQLLVFVLLFQKVVPLNIEAYPAFVFTALLPWNWFSMSVGSAGSLFINNRNFVRTSNFSPAVLMIVNTLSNLFTYLLFMPVLFLILIVYDRSMTWPLLFVPLLIVLQGILIVGLSLIAGTLNVFYRDVEHLVSVGIMLLFYLTPVFYSTEIVAKEYRFLYMLNPTVALIESYRTIFFYNRPPEWSSLLLAGGICLLVCGLGSLIYARERNSIIDTI
jgi:ABC-type polysaccharide/polyol phosphate export permease